MALAETVLAELRRIAGTNNVLTEKEDLIPYSFDGTAALRQMPGVVVFAKTTQQVVGILRFANQAKIPVVTRGSGTGLSGGSLPVPRSLPDAPSKPQRRDEHKAGKAATKALTTDGPRFYRRALSYSVNIFLKVIHR
jgi:hypothetical protein